MPTRTRRSWKPDSRGYYTRQIGWERSQTGKLQQHKFILGTDLKEAERRDRKLQELWDAFAKDSGESRPFWPVDLLSIAMQVAKGIIEIVIPRAAQEKHLQYAQRLQRLQSAYPVVAFLPEDRRAFDIGQVTLELFEAIPNKVGDLAIRELDAEVVRSVKDALQRLHDVGVILDPLLSTLAHPSDAPAHDEPLLGVIKPRDAAIASRRAAHISSDAPDQSDHHDNRPARQRPPSVTGMLHQAFEAYQKKLERESYRPETGHVTPWGRTQIRQVKNLKKHHANRTLTNLNADAVDELIGYWRQRPCKAGTNVPMTAKSCSNYLGTLVRFLKWLDLSSEFAWSKPAAFNDLDTRVRTLAIDHARKSLEQVDTFSLEELRLLMRYSHGFDRLLLLLGLNCGFGRAEISSLLVGEVYLFQGHTPREQELLGYATTEADSFIKRIRRKSGVYGEHLLFPMTVQGLQWCLERRKSFPGFAREARLVLNENGTALDQQTKGSNANQLIPNHFARLIKRIQSNGHPIRDLSFGKLRKTASDLIKRHSNGEIAGVFDCHGNPVKSDSLSDRYTNRPFGKVFQAIRDVERYLAPVFEEASTMAFESNR